MAKSKPMTKKEKELRKKVRKDLREQGILPAPKKRLNRKKFVEEAQAEFKENINSYEDIIYIKYALSCMIGGSNNITSEHVGVAKVLKLSSEIKKFEKAKNEKGESGYKISELFENVVRPVVSL